MKEIGIIKTKFKELKGMPIQPKGAQDSIGEVILKEEYKEGLLDLDGFSHIYLIYKFHKSIDYKLKVFPFMDNVEHGVFSTRAPKRPNPIGLSIVEIISIKDNIITVRGADILDGTPLLDIKPYIEKFDRVEDSKSGWMKATKEEVNEKRADDRFI